MMVRRTTASSSAGPHDEMATNWILSRRKYPLAAEADAIVDLFVGGIGQRR